MGRYVVVHDREHAKAAIESGMLFWVNWENKAVGTHWLPQSKDDAEFAMHVGQGYWGVLIEEEDD